MSRSQPHPLSRRHALGLGAGLLGAAAMGATMSREAAAAPTDGEVVLGPAISFTRDPSFPRPTGAGTVRYEDLYRSGDTLRSVVAKVGPRLLTMPEGLFEIANFQDVSQGIKIPKDMKGIVGSGRGTVIRLRERSSSYGSTVPKSGGTNQLFVLRMNNGSGQLLRNFKIEGTEQGHLYNGVMIGQSTRPIIDGLHITGVPGASNRPPGETMSLNIWRGSGSMIMNTEIDGRRSDGKRYSSSPIGYNSHTGGTLEDCYLHHTKTGGGGIAYWQTTDCITRSVRCEYIGTSSGDQAGHPLNHERSTGITHIAPKLMVNRTSGGNTGVHIVWDNDQEDGVLTVRNPTWDDPGTSGGRLLIQTHNPYGEGQKQRRAPVVTDANGKPINVNWVR